ncbi:hypothetical protein C9374_001799 [Naegleria lovaniensis]|uniref:Uncharacterized protein n=1 Tax=Naegleria lovaniensis TaxID=51637 RepID=A0AA88GUY1_NAELO|nr:uncharacterized protein C9374_001799 [Naegleria lovaniensis]KAG2387467.1 hypothetical protein C9374_001799 [Naegleria lovaniensis]
MISQPFISHAHSMYHPPQKTPPQAPPQPHEISSISNFKTFMFVEDQHSKAFRKERQVREEFKYEIALEDGYIWWSIL